MNKPILLSAVVITLGGVATAIAKGQAISKVILGGYIFLAACSLLDSFGGKIAAIAGGLSTLAMVYVLTTEFLPSMMSVYNKLIGTSATRDGKGVK